MNKYDAAKILGLSGEVTIDLVKRAYRLACSKYHPDRNPGGLEMMKLVNVAYRVLCEAGDFMAKGEQTAQYGEDLSEAINAVVTMDGVVIEICGAWVWLSGNTKAYKDQIKAAGFKWAPKKSAWYFRPDDYRSTSRGRFSMDEIRFKYGSEEVAKQEREKVTG